MVLLELSLKRNGFLKSSHQNGLVLWRRQGGYLPLREKGKKHKMCHIAVAVGQLKLTLVNK